MPLNPYLILEVSRNASTDEIKKAYRKLAHRYHPDKKGGDEAKFKEVNEAYQILSDPKKRANFDAFGFAYHDGGYQGNRSSGGGEQFWDFFGGGGFRSGGIEDIFEAFGDVFGNSFSRADQEPVRGEDIHVEVSLSKKDLGTRKVFTFDVLQACSECEATGVAKGSKKVSCTACGGSGRLRQSTKTPFGSFTRVSVCGSCKGLGTVPDRKCEQCKGTTRVGGTRKIELHIPRNLEPGYTVVVPKGGNAGKEGISPGNLILYLVLR
jgi:molecular chaperone DnaJ